MAPNEEPNAVAVIDEPDIHGGTIRTITAVSLEGDTVDESSLYAGYTAHNARGERIVGAAEPGVLLSFDVDFEDITEEFNVEFETGFSGDIYEGDYVVTPKAYDSQTLLTAGKLLEENVVVLEVPYYSVDNLKGGITASIAERI